MALQAVRTVSRVRTLGCALLVALVLVSCGGGPVTTSGDSVGAEVARNQRTVAGLPQDGITLGSLDAPATLTAFVTLDGFNQSLFRDLPVVVRRWVAPGEVKIQVRTVTTLDDTTFLGTEGGAAQAARLAHAVGVNDRLWDFLGALSARYVGNVDDQLLADSLADVQGIDPVQVGLLAKTQDVAEAIGRADDLANKEDVTSLPTYVLDQPGPPPQRLDASCDRCLVSSLARALEPGAPAGSPTPTGPPASTSPEPAPTPTAKPKRNGKRRRNRKRKSATTTLPGFPQG